MYPPVHLCIPVLGCLGYILRQCCDAGMMYVEAGLMRRDTSRHLQHKVTASPIFYKVTPAQGRSRSCRLVSTWR